MTTVSRITGLTATERRRLKLNYRRVKATERAKRVLRSLLQALDATTTYSEPLTPRTPRYRGNSVLYGFRLALQPKAGSLLDADSKPTQVELTRVWSAQPGEIITSRATKPTRRLRIDHCEKDALMRYMVQPDHSLRRI